MERLFEERQFEELVRQYSKELYRYCYSRLGSDKDLTDEAVNDVFLALYKKWDRLERGEKLRAWLYRTADYCIRHQRSQKQRYYQRHCSLEESYMEDPSAFYRWEPQEDTEQELAALEQALPPMDRELFRLRFLEKLSLQELSQRAGIPYSTLRLRLLSLEATVRKMIRDGR